MPREIFGSDFQFLPRADLLTFEEITRLAGLFIDHGVEKLRLTGGEPLLRRDLERLVSMLAGLPGLREAGDFETVAGFLINRLGHLPKSGERVEHGDVVFEVVDMDGRRIDKVLVTRVEPRYEG